MFFFFFFFFWSVCEAKTTSMKSQSCILIFAVVALFSVSKAQDQTEQNSTRKPPQENGISETSKRTFSKETTSGIPFTTLSTEPPITNKTVKKDPEITIDEPHQDPTNATDSDETGVKNNTTTASKIPTSEYMSMTAGTTSAPSEPAGSKTNSWWGYVMLAFIFVLIIALCVILFFLRRVSRTYSFDLHRPGPSHMNEPIGTFEPVYVDDLDRQIDTVQLTPFPATNGTTISPGEKKPNGEAPQDEPLTNGLQTPQPPDASPTAQTEPDQSSSPDLFLDTAREEQQNENNNNPSICSSDPFVEINLEEPQWQLFTSQTPSSVLPFSPFSFSSSSSSSSS